MVLVGGRGKVGLVARGSGLAGRSRVPRSAAGVIVVSLCALMAACTGGGGPRPAARARVAGHVSGQLRAGSLGSVRNLVSSGSAASSGSGGSGDITIAFAGDVHFIGRTARLLKHPATAFGPIASLLRSANLTMVNLETAVTSRGAPQPKYYHFRTTPVAFTALRDAGVKVATMANNHVLDYGRVGLSDTLAAAKAAHFPVVGIGVNAAAAWAPYIVTIKGVRIAILSVSQIGELASSWVATPRRSGEANTINLGRTLAAVREARKLANVVIVVMHWGTQGLTCPNPSQLALAPKLAAAGASIILGAHAHVLQGDGWLGRTFVTYGMADFVWNGPTYSNATGVMLVTLHPHQALTARFVPATVSNTGQSIPDTGLAASQASAYYRSLQPCAGLTVGPGR
jgi:Bacterial capsule synthesis protein PGA_cap